MKKNSRKNSRSSCGSKPVVCGRPLRRARATLRSLVAHYLQNDARRLADSIDWFARQGTLAAVVRAACESYGPWAQDGRIVKHPHQRRIPNAILAAAADRLCRTLRQMRRMTDFDALHEFVAAQFAAIDGLGQVAVYDVSNRIASFLEFPPERVYLHAGTLTGARALGLDTGGGSVAMENLPIELRRLTLSQAEDFLCIYADELQKIRPRRRR